MKELYRASQYYGHGSILKRYARFPQSVPIPVVVQHGWTLYPRAPEALLDVAENWYWSTSIEAAYIERFPGVCTRAVGAAFLYLLQLTDYQPTPSEQRGSIIFPSHSSALIEMESDFKTYAAQLAALPDEYKPITVCMYHLDAAKGLHRPFVEKGFEITSNGNDLFSEEFLLNFIANASGRRYAFANQMTSALLYATTMGLETFFYGPIFQAISGDENYEEIDYTAHHRSWEERFAESFRFPDADLEEQRATANSELGADMLLSTKEMNRLLWRLTRSKQYRSRFGRAFQGKLKSLFSR